MASRNPPKMARPPAVGIGASWTRRSSGRTTAPKRIDPVLTTKVSRYVETAATARTAP